MEQRAMSRKLNTEKGMKILINNQGLTPFSLLMQSIEEFF